MPDRVSNVMFRGSGNTDRLILAEAMLGKGCLRTLLAVSQPKGVINWVVRQVLAETNCPTDQLAGTTVSQCEMA